MMAIFNEKNLRRLINEKVDASASKLQEQVTALRRELDRLKIDMRSIYMNISTIKSLPVFKDAFRK